MIVYPVTAQKQKLLQDKMAAMGLQERDFKEFMRRSGGPGGQRTNKSSTAVTVRHLPSGLEARSQESRSQALNRFLAKRKLVERIERSIKKGWGRKAAPSSMVSF